MTFELISSLPSSPPDNIERPSWDIDLALDTIRKIETSLRPLDVFTSLTGGVLYKGESKKDLDIMLTRLNGTTPGFPYEKIEAVLKSLGWSRYRTADEIRAWRLSCEQLPLGGIDRHVECWTTAEGRRVDIFILEEKARTVKENVPELQCTQISVNGKKHFSIFKYISYEDVADLAYGSPRGLLTITYSVKTGDTRRTGSLCPYESVFVEDGMVFNAIDTSNA